MTMELDHVEAFLAIARSGGFARGSAALHLSQPATSRRIKLLEAELGAPLFDRLGRGVALTEAGRAFLPHAQALQASCRSSSTTNGWSRCARPGTPWRLAGPMPPRWTGSGGSPSRPRPARPPT